MEIVAIKHKLCSAVNWFAMDLTLTELFVQS